MNKFTDSCGFVHIQETLTCSNPTIETLEKDVKYEPSQWHRSGVFIVKFERITYLFYYFYCLLWNNKETFTGFPSSSLYAVSVYWNKGVVTAGFNWKEILNDI